MDNQTYDGIDEALVPLHQHIHMLLPKDFQHIEPETQTRMSIEQIEISMPIELDVIQEDNEALSLGSSPPTHYLETSFPAALHHLRITIVDEKHLLGRDA